ncbi:MAG: 2-oxoglutarate dehydrogenase complex dihydrolipoyllysine-residue succinyltransferase [Acidobacteria bacterium]|nr:2-oxoglutarate dehydrogenase complex dihydrolipoyllysine-residue succinyltransferase [Acidobacteriota bacterium]
MSVPLKVPEVGESVREGYLTEWLKDDGDVVAADEPLYVLETDKVTMTINADVGGRLAIKVPAGQEVEVGQAVAEIDDSVEAPAAPPASGPAATPDAVAETEPEQTAQAPAVPAERGEPTPQPGKAPRATATIEDLSPAVRRLVLEHDLDPASISGTGRGGRLTKEDVLRHLDESTLQTPATDVTLRPEPPAPAAAAAAPDERQTRRRMSPLRQRLAERLVEAQQTAAMLTTFNEVDMSRVIALRKQWREKFRERHGVDLGFMSFFVKAAVNALAFVPAVNAFLDGDEIVENHYYDIGVAVSTERGLVVPVIRDADRLSFAGVETGIAELAEKARTGKLTLDDLSGGVFTVSNGGIFGSMLSTPILNPPQSAILGMHAIKKRPVVAGEDDRVEVRPMMYLALSYDHRLIDGREAVTFLKRIVECLEDPERLLLEV